MCLFPVLIPNPSWPDNSGSRAFLSDFRRREKYLMENNLKGYKDSDLWRLASHLVVPCRRCPECLRSDASQWRYRLETEMTNYASSDRHIFLTLSFSDFYYRRDDFKVNYCVRELGDRLYLVFGRRIRHWYITELGSENMRLHLHGFWFAFPRLYLPNYRRKDLHRRFISRGVVYDYWTYSDFNGVVPFHLRGYDELDDFDVKEYVERYLWPYGFCWTKSVYSSGVCGYVIKYMTKYEDFTQFYKPSIFASPAIGRKDSKIAKLLSTLSLSSGNFLEDSGKGVRILPKYYRDRVRRYVSPAVYYRCLDRTMSALGLKYNCMGRKFETFESFVKFRSQMQSEVLKKYPDVFRFKERNLDILNYIPKYYNPNYGKFT